MEIENLTKAYGPVLAVDSVNFTVPDGAVTGFLGPNGAGKSTTMRCLLGLDRPDAGRTHIDGMALHRHPVPAEAAGAVLDTAWYHPGRTGRAHLKVVAASGGLAPSRVDEALEAVGLASAAQRRIQGYSLGMKQRLGLATAMLGRPRNLILDEPVNGLDPQGVRWIRSFLRRAADDGRAVLVSSHQLSEMRLVADRLVVVGRGRLIGEGELTEFLRARDKKAVVRTDADRKLEQRLHEIGGVVDSHPDGLHVTLAPPVPDLLTLSRLCHDLGVLVTALSESTADLEDAFLEATESATVHRPQS